MEWVKLVNFGEYWHSKGIQSFDEEAANAIVEYFHSIRGRLRRKFQGIPIFIGHPDDPEFSPRNGKIYGRVENVKVEDDALWIFIKWTEFGRELFQNGIINHLSPRWLTVKNKEGRLSPKRLISVGLTNHPNIPCKHVSKFEKCGKEIGDMTIGTACSKNDEAENSQKFANENSPSPEENLNQNWQGKLLGGENGSLLPELHVTSKTEGLGRSRFDRSNGEKILALVYERMMKLSENYADAWMAVKRGNSSLFYENF
ncbi:MAG: phage protease [Puniceicoccales bacterium]|nr:phage protease [Puniceicoccales bacterium]